MNDSKRDEAHKKYLEGRFEYLKNLSDKKADELRSIIFAIIAKHKIWLGFKGGDAFVRESKAFMKRTHKCGGDDIAFSNQVRIFSNKYLIDFDLIFFAAGWLNSVRLPEPDGGVGESGGGSAPRLSQVEVEPEPLPWEPTP